jgi:hypothetical protein
MHDYTVTAKVVLSCVGRQANFLLGRLFYLVDSISLAAEEGLAIIQSMGSRWARGRARR